MTLKGFVKVIGHSKVMKWAGKHAPQILMGIGVVSGVGALAGTAVATKRAIDILEEQKKAKAVVITQEDGTMTTQYPEFTKREVFNLTWKEFIIPGLMAIGSGAAFFGAWKCEHNNALGLAAVLGSTEGRLANLEADMIDKLGEKKAEEIHEAVVQREVKEKGVGDNDTTPVPDFGRPGDFICYCPITNQEFYSNNDKIMRAVAQVDRDILAYDSVTLNDFIAAVNNDNYKTWPYGDKLVWRSDKNSRGTGIRVTHALTNKKEPCLVIDYNSNPPVWED